MKSRQINYFVLPEELQTLFDHLLEDGWAIAPVELSTKEVGEHCFEEFADLPLGGSVYLFRQEDIDALHIESYNIDVDREGERHQETRHAIDPILSPAIEWWLPEIDESKRLKRGRLYFVKSYFEGETAVEKEDFTKNAESLFRWFRKHYPRVKLPELKAFHITEPVTQWLEREQGELVQFTIAS